MMPGIMKIKFALVAVLALSGQAAVAQSERTGVEKLYILNCGEGTAGDISRWSPGVNEGKSIAVRRQLLPAQAFPRLDVVGPRPGRRDHRHAGRPEAGRSEGDALVPSEDPGKPTRRARREAGRRQVRRGVAYASGPYRQRRDVPAGDALCAKGRIRLAGRQQRAALQA